MPPGKSREGEESTLNLAGTRENLQAKKINATTPSLSDASKPREEGSRLAKTAEKGLKKGRGNFKNPELLWR